MSLILLLGVVSLVGTFSLLVCCFIWFGCWSICCSVLLFYLLLCVVVLFVALWCCSICCSVVLFYLLLCVVVRLFHMLLGIVDAVRLFRLIES